MLGGGGEIKEVYQNFSLWNMNTSSIDIFRKKNKYFFGDTLVFSHGMHIHKFFRIIYSVLDKY